MRRNRDGDRARRARVRCAARGADERPRHTRAARRSTAAPSSGCATARRRPRCRWRRARRCAHDEAQRCRTSSWPSGGASTPRRSWDDALAQNAAPQGKPSGNARTAPEAASKPTTATQSAAGDAAARSDRHLRRLRRARRAGLEARDREVRGRGQRHLPRREEARRHHRHQLRHVPSQRAQHAPRDLSEVPGAAAAGGAAPRHDQLVHREPGQGQGGAPTTAAPCARSRRTSCRSVRARSSTSASTRASACARARARVSPAP